MTSIGVMPNIDVMLDTNISHVANSDSRLGDCTSLSRDEAEDRELGVGVVEISEDSMSYEWNAGYCSHSRFFSHADGTKECSDCGETEEPEEQDFWSILDEQYSEWKEGF